MNKTIQYDVWNRIADEGILAVIVVDDEQQALSTISALIDGGINAVELALRTPSALHAIERVRVAAPSLLLGVGTVLTPAQVRQCHAAGVDFALAPGVNCRVIAEAIDVMLPFVPGIATPSDIEAAVEMGCDLLKFFPAEPVGGIDYLTSIAAPYQHLNLSYIPLGGIHAENCVSYLKSPIVCAIGGSWLAPTSLIREQNWKQIRQRAALVRELIESCHVIDPIAQ